MNGWFWVAKSSSSLSSTSIESKLMYTSPSNPKTDAAAGPGVMTCGCHPWGPSASTDPNCTSDVSCKSSSLAAETDVWLEPSKEASIADSASDETLSASHCSPRASVVAVHIASQSAFVPTRGSMHSIARVHTSLARSFIPAALRSRSPVVATVSSRSPPTSRTGPSPSTLPPSTSRQNGSLCPISTIPFSPPTP